MNDIRQRWSEYETKVVPADAPYTQVRETRRAYFAGAMAVVDLLLVAIERESPRYVLKTIERFKEEGEKFRAEVESDRA